MRKSVSTILLLLVVIFAGCTSKAPNIESVVRGLPAFEKFLSNYPNADLLITYWSAEEVETIINGLEKDCEKPMAVTPLHMAKVEFENVKLVAWIDAVTYNTLCIIKKGEEGCVGGKILCDEICVETVCSSDLDCDDSEDNTIDICHNSRTCSASCSHTHVHTHAHTAP